MAHDNKYVTPAYGIPERFKTPEQVQQERLAQLQGKAIPSVGSSWVPNGDFLKTLVLSTGSSFVAGLGGDAKTLDYIFDADITKSAAYSLQNISSAINANKPVRALTAGQKTFINDDGTMGDAWSDIYAYADLAGSGLGSIAAMILGGGVLKMIAKGGIKAITRKAIKKKTDELVALNKNITRETAEKKARSQVTDYAQKYDASLGMGAYGTAEMAIVSGSVGQAIEEEVLRAPAKILNQSDRFREIYFDLLDNNDLTSDEAHNAARIKLSREAGIEGAKTVAIPSLMLGAVAGRYIDKAITGRLTKSTLANFGILESVEVPTEMVQGGVEQFVQNKVYKELIDKQRNVWAGVPDSAIREGLGVAFGVAPLALVSAKAEADKAAGIPPSIDRLTEEEELTVVDQAMKIDDAATVELLSRTEGDPQARYEGLIEIIEKGNTQEPEPTKPTEPIDLDLDLDEDALPEPIDLDLDLDEDAIAPTDLDLDIDEEALAEVEAEDAARGDVEGGVEPEPKPPVETPVPGDIAPEPPVEAPVDEGGVEPPAPKPEGQLPAYKADFDTFRAGKTSGTYTPGPAQRATATPVINTGTKQDSINFDEAESLSRPELNEVAKALGIKTIASRDTVLKRVRDVAEFTNLDIENTEPAKIVESVLAVGQALKEKVDIQRMDNAGIKTTAIALQETLAGRANEFYDRQQHREAIEAAVKTGDFTLEDFESLPETDQQAYADIGKQLRAEPAPEPETPEGDVLPPEPGKPETPEVPEGAIPDVGEGQVDTGGEEGGGEEGGVDTPTEPVGDIEPEPPTAPTPEEIEAQEAKDAADIAAREAVQLALNELEPEMKVIVRGVTLSGNKVMNPETLEFIGSSNEVYSFKKGKNERRNIREIDGNFYITSLTGKKSRKITEIERKKVLKKDQDEESETIIRRPGDRIRDHKTFDDADEQLKYISSLVSHSNYVKSVDYKEKTHGVKRFYTDLLSNIPPFLKWIAPHIGSEYGGISPKEAVLAIIRNQPLTQFNENKEVNIQTPDDLNDAVTAYVDMMTALQQLVIDAKNIEQLRNNYARSEFQQEAIEGKEFPSIDSILELSDPEYQVIYNEYARSRGFEERAKQSKLIVPILKLDDSSIGYRYPELFPKLTYAAIFGRYKDHVEFENVSDEKLKAEVPRQREKLTELAARRAGMPDHRQGKNITRKDLIEKFGFIDVVYGAWVSDLALEGEISERQQYRNLVYDSFADLAYLTGLPLKVMGKDLYLSLGKLGRGKSTGLAFFHPSYDKYNVQADETENNIRDLRTILDSNDVNYSMNESAKSLFKKVEKVVKKGDVTMDQIRIIQFTKKEGDGAFAHEWAHNLGNKLYQLEQGMAKSLQKKPSIFGLHRYVKRAVNRYIDETSEYYDEEELIQHLRGNLEQTLSPTNSDFIKPTSYMKNAKFMDMKAGKPGRQYWATGAEMYARAIEAYIHDAILAEGDGAANPFLQSPKAADGAISPKTGYLAAIYPEEEERQEFNKLLKEMFAEIETDADGDVKFRGEEFNLKFGLLADFAKIKDDYLNNLDAMIEQARNDRLERLLSEPEEEEINRLKGMSDEELDALILEPPENPEPDAPRRPKGDKKPGEGRRPRRPRDDRGGPETPPKPPKSVDDIIKDLEAGGYKLGGKHRGIMDDLMKGDESDETRFSISIDDFNDTRFSVENVQERNPDLDPELYAKLAELLSVMYAQFLDAGNQNMTDFGRDISTRAPIFTDKYRPYFLQFLKDVRDDNINYRDYVDTGDPGAEKEGEGAADGADDGGEDDGGGVQQPTDQQVGEDAGAGAATPGVAGETPAGAGRDGAIDLDNAGDNEIEGLDPEELSQRIQTETGLRSPGVEPVSTNLGITTAQVAKVPIAKIREYEGEYKVPTGMAEYMEKAVLKLSDLIVGDEYADLDEYVMKQLGYDSQEVFDDAYMSLQVEAIAAAIYQMSERRRSVIVADQTGVGKGRQAGALIRWAIKEGKVPVFVTQNKGLYTDMYYDMVDSGTDFVKPFITDTGGGIRNRDVNEDEIAQMEHDGGDVPMLHKLKDSITKKHVADIARTGAMPAGTNAVFTTYAQMDRAGARRDALSKLTESNDVVLILDESHQAAKYNKMTERAPREKRNNFFTRMITQSWGTTYLSATFAKNPENLAFYFNTDLSDAMDGMDQLVEVLTTGGLPLQEVMSRALTRAGQLFRREISYDGIDIKTEFNDKNKKRDKKNIDKLTNIIQELLPVNKEIVRELDNEFRDEPMGVANILRARNEISAEDYRRIQEAVQADEKIKITFTPVANQIHNLTDQILVASKADLAVDKILESIKAEQKPIIGLDKTNMAMLHEYITRTKKKVGDDMSDLNWSGLLKFWADKSFNVSIGIGQNPPDSERIRGNLGDGAGASVENIALLNAVKANAEKTLGDIELPLSPIDYIRQKSEERALIEVGRKINIKEITGRYSGDYGIDYSGDTPTLYKVEKFEKRSVIDAFNGEVKDRGGNKLPSTVDGMVINQSGSTGVSLHSSVKHGDRKIRHMVILEPAGDINVFQQMLGRIFRTGMGETYPLYTVLSSAIPSDARKINVLRKKMESLNAQTSSNREGAAGVAVEDIMNTYGNAAVRQWVLGNLEFQEAFENWEEQMRSEKGLAYWVTGKISIFPFDYQKDFYDAVSEIFNLAVAQAKLDGTYTLEEEFFDWEAEYLEEVTIAEPRKDKKGFNDGSWLVKLTTQTKFRAMAPDAVASAVEEGKALNIEPDAGKVKAIFDVNMQLKDSTLKEIDELVLDDPPRMNTRVFSQYKNILKEMYDSALQEIVGAENHPAARPISNSRIEGYQEYLKENREDVINALPKGTKIKFSDLERTINRAVKTALLKANQAKILKTLAVGKTYNFIAGQGTDNEFSTTGTVISLTRLDHSVDPYVLGDIVVRIAANKPGGTDDSGIIKLTLGQIESWRVDPVREWQYQTPDDINAVLTKYHETLAETSTTAEEWVVVGNPLIAASEIIPTGQYIQFSDKYKRRMFGIRMPKVAVKLGIEGMIGGRLEIPSGEVIVNYIRENPHSRLSREFGFQTRAGNVTLLLDREASGNIRFKFNTETAGEKANDPKLLGLLDVLGVPVHYFGEGGNATIEFSVGFGDAAEVINQIMRRSRLVVLGSQKYQLKNYMNIGQSVKAGDTVVSKVPPSEVETYVFEKDGSVITAHRGTYRTNGQIAKGQKGYDGFYMEGLPRFFNLEDIARLTLMKGRDNDENQGRPFLQIEEFVRGNVQNGRGRASGLGKPVLGKSTKQDGTQFKLGIGEKSRVTVVAAQESISGLPNRLSNLAKVVKSEADLPLKVRLIINNRKLNGKVKGVYHRGKIYIIADALSSADQAMIVFLHEGVGHLGLRKLMGEDLKELLDQVGNLYPEQMQDLALKYKVDLKNDDAWYEIAEEVVAHVAEKGDNRSLINKIISLFRRLMKKLGFDLVLNENDVRAILAGARRVIAANGFDTSDNQAQAQPRFSIKSNTAEIDDTIPEDTVMQGIKDGQPVDAVFRGLWGIAEATKIPKLVRFTSASALRGAMNFYDSNMEWAHPTMTYIAKGLIDQYGLTDEYKQLRASVSSMSAAILDEVRDIIEVMESMGVTDKDAEMIHEILTNEAPRSEAWDSITEPIRKRIEELGQQAVDLKLISQEAYDNNKGMYLHRVYMKYETNRSGFQKWADNLSGKRKAKIKGQETMERGKSIFIKIDRILEDTGLTSDDLIVDGMGVTIYKIDKMSANGQKSLETRYSLEPSDQEGYRVEEFTVRAKHAGRVKLWRDWTKTERKDMGQIVDARYVLGKTFSLLAHDLSTGTFFQKISENEAWTLPVDQEGDVGVVSGEAALRAGIVTGADWVRVPDTKIKKSQAKVYGALAGRVVRAEIFQDLNQLNKMQGNSIWKSILTSFKLNKTARNPVVHFNNIMSNLVLMDMADVRFSDLYRGIIEMRNKGKIYTEAKNNNAFGVSFAEQELKNEVLDKLVDEIHTATGAKPVGLEDIVLSMDSLPLNKQFAFMMKLLDGLWQGVDIKGRKVGLRQLDKKMLNYYQHEDEIFRMATYMRRRAQGMSATEAGISARDQFLNYDISAPWINAARATVLPFISYTYRAVPIVAKSLAQRPWKLAKYFTIAYGMNAIAYALTGGDEEKERKSLRDEVSGKLWIGSDRLIRMPWNNEENNPYFWDVRRLIPIGDVFDMNQYNAALPIVPASLMPSGPIAMGFEFALNKTGFFGQEIVDPLADDWAIGTQKTLDWLWKSYGPSAPWIPYSYYWDKMGIAVTGGRDRLGREYKILPALASSFGIKIAPQDVSYGVALKAMEIERTVQAVRYRLRFLEKDYWQGKVNKAKYINTRKRYILRLKMLEEKARELVQ